MNFNFHTLGCKVNQYETEAIKEAVVKLGHTCCATLPTDAIVINSCTVTAESDRKTRQLIRRCRRENPNALIVLTGCMVQAFPEKAKLLTDADIIIGNQDVNKVVEAIVNYKNQPMFCFTKHETGDPYNTLSINGFSDRTRAYMKIQDGCDRFCSYCIIPTARGRVRSRKIEDIVTEAEALANNGFCEIVLVGINLSAYGKGENFNLCDAVEAVCKVEKIKRVRLGSLEPDHITDEMLIRLKAEDKFCPQFHLSLQSGCDATLKRMNRHYDTIFYQNLISRIRNIFSNSAITTDIMVGFPGETEEEFMQSMEFVYKIGFARAHIFTYSRREGTVAAALKTQVNNSVKEARAQKMALITRKSESEFLTLQCNKIFPVLFENSNEGISQGYTPNYSRVVVKSAEKLEGKIVNVFLKKVENDHCLGEIIQ